MKFESLRPELVAPLIACSFFFRLLCSGICIILWRPTFWQNLLKLFCCLWVLNLWQVLFIWNQSSDHLCIALVDFLLNFLLSHKCQINRICRWYMVTCSFLYFEFCFSWLKKFSSLVSYEPSSIISAYIQTGITNVNSWYISEQIWI